MRQKNLFYHCIFILILTLCTVFFLQGTSSAALEDRIRVGLFYGSNALPSANLANETGSGYRFGYYDSQYQFIPLAYTTEEKITMCKDTNLYLSGGSFYETPTSSSYQLIGSYHLQPAGQYATYEQALAASSAYPYGYVAWTGGDYVVRFEFYSTEANAIADAANYSNVQIIYPSKTCYTVVSTLTGNIIFEFDAGGVACFAVSPDITGAENPKTWFKGYCYQGNFQYNRRNGNDMTVINIVDIDRYVMGVLPYEFVCSGGIESLKAGAVAIRTFACASTKHRSLDFDVCTTTDCQVYRGVYTGKEAQQVEQAALQTAGQCLFYDGDYIQALFYAANGGHTEAAENAWGYSYPYLIAQPDPYEDSIDFSTKQWSYTVTPAQVQNMLQKSGYSCSSIVSMEVAEFTPSGNVNKVIITDSAGKTITFSKDNVRMLQNISSVNYFSRRFNITPVYEGGTVVEQPTAPQSISIQDDTNLVQKDSIHVITSAGQYSVSTPVSVLTSSGIKTITDQTAEVNTGGTLTGWTIAGRGFGHNIGLSQWGAYAMAAQGFTYDAILQFYYPGTTLA